MAKSAAKNEGLALLKQVMGNTKRQKSNKGRKYGRARKRCHDYRVRDVRNKNKRRRLVRHIKQFPEDGSAVAALVRHGWKDYLPNKGEFHGRAMRRMKRRIAKAEKQHG